MASRTFRLSISPEDAPEVRRVLELDGRSSLAQLHAEILQSFGLAGTTELYAFFMSGRFWDASTAQLDPRAEGKRADKALLFRLGLPVGTSFAYLLGFETELRFVVSVLAISEAAEALAAPVLRESVGELASVAPAEAPAPEKDPPELAELVGLAEAFLDLDDELDPYADELAAARARSEPWADTDTALGDLAAFRPGAEPSPQAMQSAVPIFRNAAAAALSLVEALDGRVESFLQLDEWLLARALGTRLLDLPMSLALVQETELSLSLAQAMIFLDPELVKGDVAVILARAGRREEALALIDELLTNARDKALVEAKAGDAYRALGDPAAAEAYYQQSLKVSKTSSDRLHALLRLVACLTDSGRDAEASELLKLARKERGEPEPQTKAKSVVGRNDACPCGSGKKYKKCHGM
jgi:tetratricopeptide (TPR) repeat protein